MARRAPEPCFKCGATFTTPREAMLHVPCPAPDDGTGITRPVHCWSCAGEIDLRTTTICPTCGADYQPALERLARPATVPTCPNCGLPIRWTSAAGGWVHSVTGSIWCTDTPAEGSCALGPIEENTP